MKTKETQKHKANDICSLFIDYSVKTSCIINKTKIKINSVKNLRKIFLDHFDNISTTNNKPTCVAINSCFEYDHWLVAFDFDGCAKKTAANTSHQNFVKLLDNAGISHVVTKSKSGLGRHVWLRIKACDIDHKYEFVHWFKALKKQMRSMFDGFDMVCGSPTIYHQDGRIISYGQPVNLPRFSDLDECVIEKFYGLESVDLPSFESLMKSIGISRNKYVVSSIEVSDDLKSAVNNLVNSHKWVGDINILYEGVYVLLWMAKNDRRGGYCRRQVLIDSITKNGVNISIDCAKKIYRWARLAIGAVETLRGLGTKFKWVSDAFNWFNLLKCDVVEQSVEVFESSCGLRKRFAWANFCFDNNIRDPVVMNDEFEKMGYHTCISRARDRISDFRRILQKFLL